MKTAADVYTLLRDLVRDHPQLDLGAHVCFGSEGGRFNLYTVDGSFVEVKVQADPGRDRKRKGEGPADARAQSAYETDRTQEGLVRATNNSGKPVPHRRISRVEGNWAYDTAGTAFHCETGMKRLYPQCSPICLLTTDLAIVVKKVAAYPEGNGQGHLSAAGSTEESIAEAGRNRPTAITTTSLTGPEKDNEE